MFTVRRMIPGDFQFAADLANTMNWNMTTEDFEFNKALEPDGCFVLLDDSEPVGIATCINYGGVGWFGNLVIKENCRKKGGGSLLVKHSVNYLRRAGANSIGLYAYKHLVDFYRNLGFSKDNNFIVLRAERVRRSNKEERAKRIDLGDLGKIVEFDRRCFGASRERLLAQIIQKHGNASFIGVENGQVVGYATAKVYQELVEIGPTVCLSSHSEIALELMNALLNEITGKEAYMCLPANEKALLDLAGKAEFKKKFEVERMFLGYHFAQDCIYLAESLERG